MHPDVSVTFSDGSVYRGVDAVRGAFERNFAAISNESYAMTNVHWLLHTGEVAVYQFDFRWSGLLGGREVSGAGRGTAVLVAGDEGWLLLAEHLGRGPD